MVRTLISNSFRFDLKKNEMADFFAHIMLPPLAWGTVIATNFSVQRKYFNLNQYPSSFFRRRKW
jgi:hypothetical protein